MNFVLKVHVTLMSQKHCSLTMKKIIVKIFILLLATLPLSSAVNEYTTDLYFANGMFGEDEATEQRIWEIYVENLKSNNSFLNIQTTNVKVAYNASELWGIGDALEVLFQNFIGDTISYVKLHDQFKEYVEENNLIEVLNALSQSFNFSDLAIQISSYKEDIRNGHAVVVVAHSQGNFFTNKAFEDLDDWMEPYFHMIGVASPSLVVVKGGPRISFDNDPVPIIGFAPWTIKNKNRYTKLGLDLPILKYHGFDYYMGSLVNISDDIGIRKISTSQAYTQINSAIISALEVHFNSPSQWKKTKDIGCMCKDKRIKVAHKFDSGLDILMDDQEIYDFDEAGKIYKVGDSYDGYVRAKFGAVKIEEIDEGEVCYVLKNDNSTQIGEIKGLQEKPQTKDGVVEISLTWNKPELDYDLIVEWDAGEVDVKDTGCPMEHFHIKSEMKIYPGTYRVSIVPKDGSDESFEVEDLYPFEIDLVTRTPGASEKMHFVIKKREDISLGHVSDIKVFRIDDEDNETDDNNLEDDISSPFIIVPNIAPECPPVQITPSPVPPRPIYFSKNTGGWSYIKDNESTLIDNSGSGSGSGNNGGGTSFTLQQDPGCAGDVDCLPTPGDSENETGNPDGSIDPYRPLPPIVGGQPVRDLEKEDNCTGNESCGCIPCEYEIIPYLKQIYFGPLRDANFSIYSLEGYRSKDSLFDGKTSNGETLYDAGEIDIPQVFLNTLEDDKLYIIEAVGGEDIDSDDNFIIDDNPIKNLGKVYAIASGKDIKYTGFKVNILTTVTFELVKEMVENGSGETEIENKIAAIASRLLAYKVYPNAVDTNMTNIDLLAWLPTVDKDLLLQSYEPLEEMVAKIYVGEDIYNEAYEYVYFRPKEINGTTVDDPEAMVMDENNPPVIKVFVGNINEDAVGGTIVGKIDVLRGSEDISFGELSGKGSEIFEVVNEGEIKLRTDSTLDYETKWLYKLKVKAFNKNGSSGSVGVYISVKNVLDAPEYIRFEGGLVDENITGGTKVGQLFFTEGASPIISMEMQGEFKDLFSIDNNGTIRLAMGVTLDYEEKYSYGFVVIAKNSDGSSMPVILYINIKDIADSPRIINYTGGYVHEDANTGTFVGKVVYDQGGSSIDNIFLEGEGSENFTVDMNGTLRVSETAELDYESYALYQPTVTVTNSYGSATRRIFVSVVDSKDVPSFISFSGGNVMENSPVGTVVGQVIFDPGSMPIEFIVMSGEGSEVFKILENGTIVVVDDTLNYEEKNHYVVKVMVSNALGSSAEVTVHLFVDDVFEQPVVLEDFVINDIEENLPKSTVVGKITILAVGSSPLEFFEISGEGADRFSVDKEGVIRLERVLDFEQQEIYNLKVKAKNGAGFGNEVNLIVRLSNIAEHVPVLYAFKGFVEENASVGTVIGDVLFATKGDTPIAMRLEGEGKEKFSIDTEGKIRLISTLDYTTMSHYGLNVIAKNLAGDSNSVACNIDVTIPDTTAPIILLKGSQSVDIVENTIYTDLGATALDDIDGDITHKIVVHNPVDTDAPAGTIFTIVYNVSDIAGNAAQTVTREVMIVRDLNIDLSDWKSNGDGIWVLQSDSRTVLQTKNGNPTIYHNNVDSQSELFELTGKIKVTTSSDDDFIGFVLGYRDGDFNADNTDYLLIDWKQGDQSGARKGLAISHIANRLVNGAWAHSATQGVTELQRGFTLGDRGWSDYAEYVFRITFTSSLVEVYINDIKELSITGDFADGAYGFYNYSQERVLYSAVEAKVSNNQPPIANAGEDQNISVGDQLVLNGMQSTDDFGISSYIWSKDNTILSDEPQFVIDTLAIGVHTIRLTVEDDEELKDSDEVVVVVNGD